MRMRVLAGFAALFMAVTPLSGSAAESAAPGSRVIVSTTLSSSLMVLDANSLAFTQPPLLSRGGGPVRMVVTYDGCGSYDCNDPRLFVANHGVAGGSVGMFDLSGEIVVESILSPFPARAGAVGIDASRAQIPGGPQTTAVFVTNTTFALGGCGMPAGSVTAFERFLVSTPSSPAGPYLEAMREAGTVDVSAPIPYAVAIAGPHGKAYASTNCGDTLEEIELKDNGGFAVDHPAYKPVATGNVRSTSAGPDGVVYDPETDRLFVVNIDGSSVAAYPAGSGAKIAETPLPGARPIDLTLADSPSGARWVITSNGGNDTVSIVERSTLAVKATIATGVPGGAPEGVAYDPASNRVFVVNKTIGAPSLTVIQLTESGSSVSGAAIATIPLDIVDGVVPNIIAFDVVVQTR